MGKRTGMSPAHKKEFGKLSQRYMKGQIGMSHYKRQTSKLRKKYAKKRK